MSAAAEGEKLLLLTIWEQQGGRAGLPRGYL